MNFIKRSGWILLGSVILAIGLGTGCAKTAQSSKEKVVEELCEELFTFPSENNNKVLEAMENSTGGVVLGMGTEAIEKPEEDNWHDVLNEVYGKYFTETELEDFYNERVFLDILLEAEKQGCEMKFEKIEKIKASTEQDNTEKYMIEIVIDGKHVEEEILVAFEDQKISYFSLTDHKIQEIIQ